MILLTFQPSAKYICLQTLPYYLLSLVAAYLTWFYHPIIFPFYLVLTGLAFYRLLSLCAMVYQFTQDMLIVTQGLVFKKVECRSILQLQGVAIRANRLLCLLHVSHVDFGLEGPAEERITLTGVNNRHMREVTGELMTHLKTRADLFKDLYTHAN